MRAAYWSKIAELTREIEERDKHRAQLDDLTMRRREKHRAQLDDLTMRRLEDAVEAGRSDNIAEVVRLPMSRPCVYLGGGD